MNQNKNQNNLVILEVTKLINLFIKGLELENKNEYKLKYFFNSRDNNLIICEIKILNQPLVTNKDRIYFWLEIENLKTIKHLEFLSLENGIRKFKNGNQLVILEDEKTAKYIFEGNCLEMKRSDF